MLNEEKKSHTLPMRRNEYEGANGEAASIKHAHSHSQFRTYFLFYLKKKGINHRRHSTPPVMQHSNDMYEKSFVYIKCSFRRNRFSLVLAINRSIGHRGTRASLKHYSNQTNA